MKRFLSVLFGISLLLITNLTFGGEKMIQQGSKVKFDYTLVVEGQVVDTSKGKQPLEYVHGQGTIIPGLESQILGLKEGDEKKVVVGPEDAYGVIKSEAIVEVNKAQLGSERQPQIGDHLQMKNTEGNTFNGVVKEIKDEIVVVDFNHPLAGKELIFDIKIVDIEK